MHTPHHLLPVLAGALLALSTSSCVSALEDGSLSNESDGYAQAAPIMTPKLTGDGVFFVVSDNPKRPLARYADGQLSMSNSCAIKLENKLNRRIPPAYVNGQPIGFC